MRRYLLDSNAAGLYVHRRGGMADRVRAERAAGAAVGTAYPVAAELFAGAEYSATRDRNVPLVTGRLNTLRLWPFDLAAAREYGRLYAALRRAGDGIQAVDLMVAAIARTLPDCVVVSSDGDLRRVPGLAVVDWSAPRATPPPAGGGPSAPAPGLRPPPST